MAAGQINEVSPGNPEVCVFADNDCEERVIDLTMAKNGPPAANGDSVRWSTTHEADGTTELYAPAMRER